MNLGRTVALSGQTKGLFQAEVDTPRRFLEFALYGELRYFHCGTS